MKSMSRRRFLELAGGLAFASVFPARSDAKTFRPPNFVFVLADDFGWSQLRCYGSSYYECPGIFEHTG